ncbi:MAG: hypothetical protein SynsKO_43030 [Synoicihabitans sp.]
MNYDESLVKLRFVGEKLDQKAIPIYELGTALVALQRLIHKAHLSRLDRLSESNYPSKKERINLALQLGARRRLSDAYGLVPVNAEEGNFDYISELADFAIKNIAAYESVADFDYFQRIADNRKLYIINIYNQISALSDRIGNVGGIESIEISGHLSGDARAVYITSETRDLVKTVKGRLMKGPLTQLLGEVVDFNPVGNIVRLLVDSQNRVMAVRMTLDDFSRVRYSRQRRPRLRVEGWPLHKMGVESLKYESFEARIVDIN